MPMAALERPAEDSVGVVGGATSASASAVGAGTDMHDEAWEAAQHILRAINFGFQDATAATHASTGTIAGQDGGVRTTLTDEERAEVQRHLERLATVSSSRTSDRIPS